LALVVSASSVTACDDNTARSGHRPANDGPVEFEGARIVQSAGIRAHGGQHVVFGATTVRNTGSQTATLQSGELVGSVDDAGASLEAVRVVDISSGGDLVGAAIWPYEGFNEASEPIGGFSLGPGDEAELLYIVDIRKAGESFWPNSAIDYRVADMNYRAESNFGFRVCPPRPAACGEE
jgi:hypothetical protein